MRQKNRLGGLNDSISKATASALVNQNALQGLAMLDESINLAPLWTRANTEKNAAGDTRRGKDERAAEISGIIIYSYPAVRFLPP